MLSRHARISRVATSTVFKAAIAVGIAAVAIVATSVGAQAQPFKAFYIGAGAGYNLPQDVNVKTPFATNPRTSLSTEGGLVALGSFGYGFGNGVRLELEGNFRNTGVSSIGSSTSGPAGGSLQTYGVMANALFDMDVGSPWIYPYIGGGLGYAWTNAKGLTVSTLTGSARSDETQGSFAVQAIAGLSFPMPGVPGLSLTSEYRFFATLANESFNGTASPSGASSTITLQRQYNHSFMLGVRYAFNVQPPAMPPAPTPVAAVTPSRSYLVFFDWDKATLTDRARQIIKEAADNSTKVKYTRIEANGYTDTSGSKAYNQQLSVRRAQAVAAELVKNGVPRNVITATGYGDTKLLVPTGAGVREPQNRRVEIIIR